MEEWLRKPNPTPEPDLFILPGVPAGSEDPDVMRGEETQIFGAVSMGNHGLLGMSLSLLNYQRQASLGLILRSVLFDLKVRVALASAMRSWRALLRTGSCL